MANTDRYSWNVQIDDTEYLLEYMKGSIYINGGEAFKLRSLERTGSLRKDKQLSYTVPLAGKELNLVISAVSGISLIMDGMDLDSSILCIIFYRLLGNNGWCCWRCHRRLAARNCGSRDVYGC